MTRSREEQIARLRSACGCKAGMATMLVAVATYVIVGDGGSGLGHRLLVGAGIGLGGAIVGKCAGLVWARVRLAMLLRNLTVSSGPTP
jgi:hypothetical protein